MREHWGLLELRPGFGHRRSLGIGDEKDEMGIADIDCRPAETLSAGEDIAQYPLAFASVRESDLKRKTFAHIHSDIPYLSLVIQVEIQHLDA
jgi:hypothetical protein